MSLRVLVGCKRAIDYAVKVNQNSVIELKHNLNYYYILKLNDRFK
jgi:hypothetical protein